MKVESEKKIVVYTAIFGKKDDLITPSYIPPGVDFICFTDQPFRSRIWQVRKVDPPVPGDMTRSARQYKILPHKYLPEYETSIWIDGNVLIRGDITNLSKEYLKGTNLAVFDHATALAMPLVTLKEHEERLLAMEAVGKHQENAELVKQQGVHYRSLGYPDTDGLAWTLVLLRRHNEPDVVSAMEMWWKELLEWSKRDQMSFNYVAWKMGLKFNYIPLDGADNLYMKRLNHYLTPKQQLYSYYLGAKKRIIGLLGMIRK